MLKLRLTASSEQDPIAGLLICQRHAQWFEVDRRLGATVHTERKGRQGRCGSKGIGISCFSPFRCRLIHGHRPEIRSRQRVGARGTLAEDSVGMHCRWKCIFAQPRQAHTESFKEDSSH